MKSFLVAVSLLAVALAGCSDDASESTAGGGAAASKVAEKPQWNLTDYWTYQSSDGESTTYVVALEEGNSWQLLPTSLSTALYDWSPGISFVGTIAQSTLGGKQDAGFVEFFNFPIEHNETWQTSWDGETRHLTAEARDDGSWYIIVTTPGAGTKFADFVYDPDVKWFKELTFYNETDGSEQFGIKLTDSGTGFTGEVYRYIDVQPEALTIDQVGPGTPQGTVSVDDEVSELAMFLILDCGGEQGVVGVGVQEPQDDGSAQLAPPVLSVVDQGPTTIGEIGQCPGIEGEMDDLVVDPKPGTWRADGVVGNTEGEVHLRIELRTFETFTF